MRRGLSACLCALALCSSAAGAPASASEYSLVSDLRWAKEVCLNPEYGDRLDTIRLWRHPISLSFVEGEESPIVRDVIRDLNRALGGTGIELSLIRPGDQGADIEIYVAEPRRLSTVAREHGFSFVEGSTGFCNARHRPDYEIYKAQVLLKAGLDERRLRHVLYEEITQCLGFMNDSGIYRDSLFYQYGRETAIQGLAAVDEALIRFAYSYLRPGDGAAAFEERFRERWGELRSPPGGP